MPDPYSREHDEHKKTDIELHIESVQSKIDELIKEREELNNAKNNRNRL